MKEADQILLDLKRKIFKPIYFLCGEEPYFIDLISDHIEKHALEDADKEFNQNVVYGKDTDLASVISLAKQFPMMSEHQVVIVKEAQNLKEIAKGSSSDEEEDQSKPSAKSSSNAVQQFAAYIANPQPTTILVFCYKYKTPDKRSAFVKALQKNAVFLETKKLYDNKIPDWITERVKERGYTISPKASYLMAEFLGNDLSKIMNEIDKLTINLPKASSISAEHVQENIGISKDFNVFELQEAFATRDVLRANRIIHHFAANEKEHPAPLIVGSLYSYFSKLLVVNYLSDKSKGSVASALGTNPFFVDGYLKAASLYNPEKLTAIFSYLKEYDLKSKGVENSSASSGDLLKELTFKILH